jgi:aryl-alcohol dehydrogenase-like predicted oxidoreductase
MGDKKDHIHSNIGGNGSKGMKLSLEASLKKLGTTYIDLFYVHWWDYTVTIPELMHSLNDLVACEKVLYLGLSDTPACLVSMANGYARTHGLRPFSVYQGMWNASMRDFERDIIPMCQHQGMALAPYGIPNQGRFQNVQVFKEREKHNPGRNFIATSERDKQVSHVLEELSNAKGVNLLDFALAYVLQKTPHVFAIVG